MNEYQLGEWFAMSGENEVTGFFSYRRPGRGHRSLLVEFKLPGSTRDLPFWKEVADTYAGESNKGTRFFMDDGWLTQPGVKVSKVG